MKDSDANSQASQNNNVELIDAVKTPLGFFTLIVLLVEVVMGIVASMSSGIDRTNLITGMIVLIFTLVFIVAGMAFFRPASLYGKAKEKDLPIDEMTVEKLNTVFNRLDDYIEKDAEAENITSIVDDTLEHTRDTWLKLLIIRMTLRRLLLKVGSANSLSFPSSSSISNMSETFRSQGIIDKYLFDDVEKIRDATYKVEWGQGISPDPSNLKFTLEEYGNVFDALKKRAHPTQKVG